MYQSWLHPTLYTPADSTPKRLAEIANNQKIERDGSVFERGIWRAVICTEDSIREDKLDDALENIKRTLRMVHADSQVCLFVRVRNLDVMKAVLDMEGAEKLEGFVVPKVDEDFSEYIATLRSYSHKSFKLMPILEHKRTVDPIFRATLRDMFEDNRGMIDCVRIGATDLLGYQGVRRERGKSVFSGRIGKTIFDIIEEFKILSNFNVSAPVYEWFGANYDSNLISEVRTAMSEGLFGQTVIHPRQLGIIRDAYKVQPGDYEAAREILKGDHAVSGNDGRMQETAPHSPWAANIQERADLFGLTTMQLRTNKKGK